MNSEQFEKKIQDTLEITFANFQSANIFNPKPVIDQNVAMWTLLKNDIVSSRIPAAEKARLGKLCDDTFKEYCRKAESL